MRIALAVALIAVLARNQIADAAIEYFGSLFLGNSVEVREVRIGFKTVEINGLEVKETSLADVPQLKIHAICIAPTIWRGMRHGVWLRNVDVRAPTLHLRFDRDGKLLSRFPESVEATPKEHCNSRLVERVLRMPL